MILLKNMLHTHLNCTKKAIKKTAEATVGSIGNKIFHKNTNKLILKKENTNTKENTYNQ